MAVGSEFCLKEDLGIIGGRLKSLRRRRGLTQEALAEVVDVTPQAIGMWETGTRKRIWGPHLVRLARALVVNPAYLVEQDAPETYDDRLPRDWDEAVRRALAHDFTPEDVDRALRAYRELLGKREN